ncbi:MAG: hypothetical protein ABIJ18_05885 [archaeon]
MVRLIIGKEYLSLSCRIPMIAKLMYDNNLARVKDEEEIIYVLRVRDKFYPERLSCYVCLREIFETAITLEQRSEEETFNMHQSCCGIKVRERRILRLA